MLVTTLYLSENVLDSECPPDLRTDEGNHTELLSNPLNTVLFRVIVDTSLCNHCKGPLHLIINSAHPFFDLAFRFNWGFELILFTFIRSHVSNDLISLTECKLLTVVKQLEHMWLDGFNVRSTQNLKQIFIGNEVESWTDHLLRVQILGK